MNDKEKRMPGSILTTVCDNRMITKFLFFADLITDYSLLSTCRINECGLSQIICLYLISFGSLFDYSMASYRSSHST